MLFCVNYMRDSQICDITYTMCVFFGGAKWDENFAKSSLGRKLWGFSCPTLIYLGLASTIPDPLVP